MFEFFVNMLEDSPNFPFCARCRNSPENYPLRNGWLDGRRTFVAENKRICHYKPTERGGCLWFDSWSSKDDGYFENSDEAFQLMITKQFVRVDCYNLTEYNMNRIIDIMLKYECPLYDAAIDVRFD